MTIHIKADVEVMRYKGRWHWTVIMGGRPVASGRSRFFPVAAGRAARAGAKAMVKAYVRQRYPR